MQGPALQNELSRDMAERRLARDGIAYTEEEFLEEYGHRGHATERWTEKINKWCWDVILHYLPVSPQQRANGIAVASRVMNVRWRKYHLSIMNVRWRE